MRNRHTAWVLAVTAPTPRAFAAAAGRALLTGAACALAWLLPSLLHAQIPPAGSEFQVNTYTPGTQDYPAVASSDGSFVVVWTGYGGQDGDSAGVFGQRYASGGSALGTEFQVNSYTTSNQRGAAVAAAANGNFVVVWNSNGQDGDYSGVFGQRFASNGSALGGEFQVNTYTTSDQYLPAVAAASNGDFVVVWQSYDQDGFDSGIFGQRYASNGSALGTEFQVNTYTTDRQQYPAVAAASNGDFVVVWESDGGQDGNGAGIFGQRFASSGSASGSEFQVNTTTLGYQYQAAVAAAANGDFVVVWSSADGGSYGVFGQRYASNGSAVGAEFQVNTYTTASQAYASIGAAANGDFVVVWNSNGQDGSSRGVFGQAFASNGSPVGTEFQVNSFTTDFQGDSAVGVAPNGNFVVTWDGDSQDGSSYGVFAQRYAAPVMSSGCAPTPLTGCADPGKSLLLIKDKGEDGGSAGDKLVWKWLKGPQIMQTEFGDPTTSAGYHFCIYAGSAAAITASVPAGMPWAAISDKGYKYKDAAAGVDGIKQILLKGGGAGKSKLLVKGKDAGLDLTASTLPFSSTDVTVQLSNSDNSNCWESTFTVAAAKKNTEGQFKAKSP